MVNAAGNESFSGTIENWSTAHICSAKDLAPWFLRVGALLDDGLHLTSFTNQPGANMILAKRTISAIGQNIPTLCWAANGGGALVEEALVEGSSFAAPIVTSAAAIVTGYIREERTKHGLPGDVPMDRVAQILLDSCTPIVLVKTTEDERKKIGYALEKLTPVALEGVLARDFKPGVVYTPLEGPIRRKIVVSEDMYKTSLGRYGMGRLDVKAALELAKEEFGIGLGS
jgi:hypothetical protein